MAPNINQFKQSPVKGQQDMSFNSNTVSCQVASDEATPLVAGQAVKIVDVGGGVPKITACTDDADDVFGFINYDVKSPTFAANARCEVSALQDNCMYMEASAAIARWAEVMILVSGQKVLTATSNNRIVGRALDKATEDGDLIRVVIMLPGALKA